LRPGNRLNLGFALLNAGQDQEASRLLEEGFELAKALGERFQMAHGLGYLGQLSMYRGDYVQARQQFEQSLRLFEEIENVHVMLITANAFGRLLLRMGELEEARNRFRRNLALPRESGRRQAIANALAGLAMVDVRTLHFERATELFGTAQALRASAGLVPTPFEVDEEERHIAPLRSTLADAAFESIWTRGTAVDMDEAIQRALEVEPLPRA
jgi:tetratricopeptide (TPR) repeat protein